MIPAAPRSFLVIQTAFTGDVILATALIEKLHSFYPDASIDFLLRKGNEGLLKEHPYLRAVIVWDKKNGKIRNLFRIIGQVRKQRYDLLVNVHRFASSGIISALSRARRTVGFDKNPLSFLYSTRVPHVIGNGTHETVRNQQLISDVTDESSAKPKLYPSTNDFSKAAAIKIPLAGSVPYYCVAPTSVWFTKQYPAEKWIEFLNHPDVMATPVFLLGAPSDFSIAEIIRSSSAHRQVVNLAGKLGYLESAALMHGAKMNFVNDSAPMHLASSMNAPVTAIFCSTVPGFGFGPLSDDSRVVQTNVKLECRPCGLHGFKACPLGHFNCAKTIDTAQLLAV